MKRILTIISLAILSVTTSTAQESKQLLTFDLGGGLHSINYDATNGDRTSGFGGTINFGYHHFFNEHWGIGTGIGPTTLSSKVKYSFMDSQTSYDEAMNENYEFRTYYSNLTEKQNVIELSIPIAVNFKTPINEKWGFAGALGGKINFPISGKYKLTDGSYETRGYYSSTNVEYSDLPQHGFLKTQAANVSDDLDLESVNFYRFGSDSQNWRKSGFVFRSIF